MNLNETKELEEKFVDEIYYVISNLAEGKYGECKVKETQPPFSVRQAMATAAAQVLIAFERGYLMNDSE